MIRNFSTIGEVQALEGLLNERIAGQQEVISELLMSIALREAATVPPRGARSAFILIGPTGVGKTELVAALANLLFGPRGISRFDGSEFSLPEQMKDSLREKPAGAFLRAYTETPSGIWLFDEIEKSSTDFRDLLLQITDCGHLTLERGRVLNLSEIYILVTSNIASREILERENLPFSSLRNHVTKSLESWMRPELLARFETPFVFRPLTFESQEEIARRRIETLIAWQAEKHGRLITVDAGVVKFVTAKGFSPRYGARGLLRRVDREIGLALLVSSAKSGRVQIEGERLVLKEGL